MAQDISRRFVRHEEEIRAASKPDRVHRDGIGDNDDAPAGAAIGATENLIEQMRIRRINRNDHVRPKARQQCAQSMFHREQESEISAEIFLSIERPVKRRPHARRTADHGEIPAPRQIIERPIGFGEQIVQFDVRRIVTNEGQTVAQAARGAVVSFAETGGENQDFFHDSLGQSVARRMRGDFNGYLSSAK